MPLALRHVILLSLCTLAAAATQAAAQSDSSASRAITPSVFAGAAGVDTGLNSGTNFSITAGLNVAFRPNSTLQPALEYRATYALGKGQVDSIDNNLVGLKISRAYTRLRPYATLLAGRGETTYANGGYQVPNKPIFYTQSASNVYSLGGGTDIVTTRTLALKLDLQIQRYASPVTTSGHLYSETATLALVYTFHIGHAAL